ncbi:MAG: hypothetical protein NVS2B15_19380 [Pseudarthrobacter sp.]
MVPVTPAAFGSFPRPANMKASSMENRSNDTDVQTMPWNASAAAAAREAAASYDSDCGESRCFYCTGPETD